MQSGEFKSVAAPAKAAGIYPDKPKRITASPDKSLLAKSLLQAYGPDGCEELIGVLRRGCRGRSVTWRPLLHWVSMSRAVCGLGAARIRASTSACSRYSGSVEPFPPEFCCIRRCCGYIPWGRRLASFVVVTAHHGTFCVVLFHARRIALTYRIDQLHQ